MTLGCDTPVHDQEMQRFSLILLLGLLVTTAVQAAFFGFIVQGFTVINNLFLAPSTPLFSSNSNSDTVVFAIDAIEPSERAVIIDEINDLKNGIMYAYPSQSRMIQISEMISAMRDEPRAPIFWKVHLNNLDELFDKPMMRIPESILLEYLHFVSDRILSSFQCFKGEYRSIVDRTVRLLCTMISLGISPELLKPLLRNERIRPYIRERHVISLYASSHKYFNKLDSPFEYFEETSTLKRLARALKVYWSIFAIFDMNPERFSNVNIISRLPHKYQPLMDLVPLYNMMLYKRIENDKLNEFKLATKLCYDHLIVFNLMLEDTDFNNNFMLSPEVTEWKSRFFAHMKRILFSEEHSLAKILCYCLDKEFMHLYEALLIFEPKNMKKFKQELILFLSSVIVTPTMKVSVYASILAVFPSITVEMVDDLVNALRNNIDPQTQAITPSYLAAFKVIILATETIPADDSIWNMSAELKAMLIANQSLKIRTKTLDLFQAARIYLYRRFGIPFTRTKFSEQNPEEPDWAEMIGFAEFFLERQCKLSGVDYHSLPHLTTEALPLPDFVSVQNDAHSETTSSRLGFCSDKGISFEACIENRRINLSNKLN